MTMSSETPPTDFKFYEVKLTIAIPDYGIEDELDVQSFITLYQDCVMLGFEETPLTLNR